MIQKLLNLFIERKMFFLDLLFKHIYLSYSVVIISAIIGISLAIIIEKNKNIAKIVISTINFLYTLPSIAMFGFLIPFFGIGNKTAIISLVIYALLPIVSNTYTGIKSIENNYIHAAEAMGTNKFQLLYKIKLPLASSFIFSGIRNSLTMTIALTGIASFIGAGGLGVGIYRGITTNNTDLTIISSLLIALFAIFSDFLIIFIEKIFFNKKSKFKNLKGFLLVFLLIPIFISIKPEEMLGEKSVTLATKPMTEQYIIGEMLKQAIEYNSDIKVNLVSGVGGGTSNIHIGMLNKEFDLYPEYTGTSWMQVLNKQNYKEEYFNTMNDIYEKEFNLKYVNLYGFNNTYSIAVRKDIADKYNIVTYSDLKKISKDLIFGAEYDFFERSDGYTAFSNFYNIKFKETQDMDISLKYKALEQNKIDVAVVFTTDALLNSPNIKVLVDDKNFYTSYMAGTVIRIDTLKKYPVLYDILAKFENILDDNTMIKLNYLVENEKQEAYKVARDFLLEKGIIK